MTPTSPTTPGSAQGPTSRNLPADAPGTQGSVSSPGTQGSNVPFLTDDAPSAQGATPATAASTQGATAAADKGAGSGACRETSTVVGTDVSQAGNPPLFSVKMRASLSGTHVSGAECIVPLSLVPQVSADFQARALSHPKARALGRTPDSITVTATAIDAAKLQRIPALPANALSCTDPTEAREIFAAHASWAAVEVLYSMRDERGALLVTESGQLLAPVVRCATVSADYQVPNNACTNTAMPQAGRDPKLPFHEALVLASKVLAHPLVIAELCISDDPDYTTGYVATKRGYLRIPNVKPTGSDFGGRVYLVADSVLDEGNPLAELIDYLRNTPVIITDLPKSPPQPASSTTFGPVPACPELP